MPSILSYHLLAADMKPELIIALATAIPSFLIALISLYVAMRKTPTEVKKTTAESHKADAEADNLHAQVADRWAEHVIELKTQVRNLDLDVSQVRRENEMYRIELAERDQVIADLKNWAERLLRQLRKHAPTVKPEAYISHHADIIDDGSGMAGC